MNDDSFERDLAAMLAARDPGPAPARLETAVRYRIASDRGSSAGARILRVAGQAASLGAVAAVLVLAFVLIRPPSPGPGAGSAPAPTAYVLKAGDGIVSPEAPPVLQFVAWVVVLVGLGRLALRARARWLMSATTLAIVGWIWVAANVGASDALVQEGGVFGALPPSARQPDTSSMFIGVDGDQPFHVVVTVTNGSRLPLVIRGLARDTRDPVRIPPIFPRFVALGLLPPTDMRLEATQPFHPVTVAAGESVDLNILGMAGACALSVPPAGRIAGGFTTLESVSLVYEQLTIVHTQSVPLSYKVSIWWPDECT